MADKKITELTALTTPASDDVLPIVDISASETKKITRANLITGLASSGANSDITSLTGLTTPLSVGQGGTGASDVAGAKTNLGFMTDLVDDTSPQLGGDLDMNGHNIEGVTPTEIGYLSGVTSSIQTQLDNKLSNVSEDTSPQLGGELDANSHKIINLTDPTNDQDAATKKYVDENAGGGGTDLFDTTKFTYSGIFVKDGGYKETSGSGIIGQDIYNNLKIDTGSTANSYAHWAPRSVDSFKGFAKNIFIRVLGIVAGATTTNGKIYWYLLSDNRNPASATKYVGIRVEGSTVYAVSKDGSTEESTDITSSFGTLEWTSKDIMIKFTSGSDVKFYVNGTLVATHSTHIPPSSDTTTVIYSAFRVENNADAASESSMMRYIVAQREL